MAQPVYPAHKRVPKEHTLQGQEPTHFPGHMLFIPPSPGLLVIPAHAKRAQRGKRGSQLG